MPTTVRPTRAMTTVMPAKTTAEPAVAGGLGGRLGGLEPVAQVLAVAGEDEQRVVDADREAEHRGQDRGGRRRRRRRR